MQKSTPIYQQKETGQPGLSLCRLPEIEIGLLSDFPLLFQDLCLAVFFHEQLKDLESYKNENQYLRNQLSRQEALEAVNALLADQIEELNASALEPQNKKGATEASDQPKPKNPRFFSRH